MTTTSPIGNCKGGEISPFDGAAAAASPTSVISTSCACRSIMPCSPPPAKRRQQDDTTNCASNSKKSKKSKGLVVSCNTAAAPNNNNNNESECPLLSLLTDEALTAHMFTFLGPAGTSICAATCVEWHRVATTSCPLLWKQFVQDDFGFHLAEDTAIKGTTSTKDQVITVHNKSLDAAPAATSKFTTKISLKRCHQSTTTTAKTTATNWQQVYSYLALQYPPPQLRRQPPPPQRLEASVVFADDGGNFPGYPPSNALRPEKSMVWCTRTGVDANVDLIIKLREVSLVTGFVAANGGRGYSAPLKEGLAFVSMEPPNLTAAKWFDYNPTSLISGNSNSSTTNNNNNNSNNNNNDRDSEDHQLENNNSINKGRDWIQYLFQEANGTIDDANHLAVAATAPQQARWSEVLQDSSSNNNHDNNNNANNGAAGLGNAQLTGQTQTQPVGNGSTHPKQQRPPSNPNGPDPVASFWFPNLQQAYHGQAQQHLVKPIVGRYIHLKLLSSHSPPGLEHISDNIDLMHFHTLGIPVPEICALVPGLQAEEVAPPRYQRKHEKRPQRLPTHDNNDDDNNEEEDDDDRVILDFDFVLEF
jgi:hypothetical protein